MPNSNYVKQVFEGVQKIQEIDRTHLIEKNLPEGVPDFSDLLPFLDATQTMLAGVQREHIEKLTDEILNPYRNSFSKLSDGLFRAANFRIGGDTNIKSERDAINRDVEAGYSESGVFVQVIGALGRASLPPEELPEVRQWRERISEFVEGAERIQNDFVSNAKTVLEEIGQTREKVESQASESERLYGQLEDLLNASKEASSEIAVSEQSKHFKNEADSHSKAAATWMKYTLLSVLLFLVLAVPGSFESLIGLTSPSTLAALTDAEFQKGILGVPLAYLLGKLVTLGAISFLIGVCAKNYLSHRHNTVLNRHRVNALMTFQALAQSAMTDTSRDVILHHAASCIFNPQDTGFGKIGQAGPGINIIEAAQKVANAAVPGTKA